MKPLQSLQARLVLLVTALVLLVWLATTILTWFDARHELDELLDSHLAQAAALLVVQQAREVDDDDSSLDAPALHRYAPKAAFQVFHDGNLVMKSANATSTPMIPSADEFRSGFRTLQIEGKAWRVFAAHGAKRDVQVYVGEQVESRAAILWAVLRSTAWPVLAALPLLALAIWWAVQRGMSPLRKLGHALADRSPQSLHPVVLVRAPSEMQPVLNSLNGLLTRIQSLIDSERRFTADAAHELRTPIAAIRAQAQVAMLEPNEGQRRHALQATLEGCDRASRLVEQLLTLSRLEAGTVPAMSALNLADLTRQVVANLAPAASGRQQSVELNTASDALAIQVSGDADLLSVLIRNLVDNASRYSPPGGRINIAVTANANSAQLCVEDSGPGMADTDLQRLGERFFRVLGSDVPGSGLGWSIVRRIAEVHNAQVDVGRSAQLGGLRVAVSVPMMQRDVR